LPRLFYSFAWRFLKYDFILGLKISRNRLYFRKSDLLRFFFINFYKIKSCKWSILWVIWILTSKFQRIWSLVTISRADHITTSYFSIFDHTLCHAYLLKLKSLLVLFSRLRLWYLNSRSFLNEILFEQNVIWSVCNKGKFSKRPWILSKLFRLNCFLLNWFAWPDLMCVLYLDSSYLWRFYYRGFSRSSLL